MLTNLRSRAIDETAAGNSGGVRRCVAIAVFAVLLLASRQSADALSFIGTQRNNSNGVSGLAGVLSVTVSSDGRYLYAAGFSDDAVSSFSIDPTTGALTFVETKRSGVGGVQGIAGATSIAISPDDAMVYVAGGNDDAIAVFSRDAASGRLTFRQVVRDGADGVSGLMTPLAVTVSPDARHVYAAAFGSDALVVFRRDATSGELTFVETVAETVGIIDGLRGVKDVAVSPDGAHVYAAGQTDNAITLFDRDASSGMLSFVAVQQDGIDGVDGLAATASVVVTPDGRNVYAAGFNDEAVAIFRRDAGNGRLTFVGVERDSVGGVSGLVNPVDVAVSDDGAHLYVASSGSNALAVFDRDASTGALGFVEAQTQAENGVDGLTGASGVAVSPNDAFVYVAGSVDNALAEFAGSLPPAPTPTATPTGTRMALPTATATVGGGITPSQAVTSSGGGGGCAVSGPDRASGSLAIFGMLLALLLRKRK